MRIFVGDSANSRMHDEKKTESASWGHSENTRLPGNEDGFLFPLDPFRDWFRSIGDKDRAAEQPV